MDYFIQLRGLMIEVMLPLTLLVAAGALWPHIYADANPELLRTQLNRVVMYIFYPCILFAVASSTPITPALLSVPLLVGIGTLVSGVLLYLLLYKSPLGKNLSDSTRAVLMIGGMWGNTFNIGAPALIFFFGKDAVRYAIYNDVLMTMPLVWSLGVWIATRLGSHEKGVNYPSVWRVMASMPPIWAFILGFASQQLGLTYQPLVSAAHFVGQAAIPVVLFVLGLTIPWRNLTPRPEILAAAAVKLLVMPLIVWLAARELFPVMGQAQYAAVVEATTPAMMTTLLLADRFKLDSATAGLIVGWTTVLFWLSLPLVMGLGMIK
ncbi:MAG: AEC family transporter [Betaproteobacteria bacterium]|nr:AEC family transporter [Betaproteobacteria bacterium]